MFAYVNTFSYLCNIESNIAIITKNGRPPIRKGSQNNMRHTMEVLMDTCHDVIIHLRVASVEVSYYEDGSYADFKVDQIKDPKTLNRIIGNLDYSIFSQDEKIVIRVYEDYCE